MRKLLFIFIGCAFASCKKDKLGNDLEGRWELVKVYSWLPVTAPAPGQVLSFTGNTFEYRRNDTLLYSGNCHTEKKKDCYTARILLLVMDYNNGGTTDLYYEIKGDSLTLSTSSCLTDGSTSVYKKKL